MFIGNANGHIQIVQINQNIVQINQKILNN